MNECTNLCQNRMICGKCELTGKLCKYTGAEEQGFTEFRCFSLRNCEGDRMLVKLYGDADKGYVFENVRHFVEAGFHFKLEPYKTKYNGNGGK